MRARPKAAPPAPRVPHRDPNEFAARGYVCLREFDYDAGTETTWPLVQLVDTATGKKTFAWGAPVTNDWRKE
jgi:hypothetical protein